MKKLFYKKVIELAPDLKKQIAKELGCTTATVYNALNLTYPTCGEQPDLIRKMAMKMGGKEDRKAKWISC